MTLASIALAIAAATASPVPSPAPTPIAWVEAGGSSASLTQGRGTWHSAYLDLGTQAGRREFDAELLRTRRFGIADTQLVAGAYWPSSPATIAHVEFDWSPTHGILPRLALAASLEHRLDLGWGYILGLGTRSYTGLAVRTQSFVVDRYWKSYRVAYTAYGAEISGVPGIALDHALTFAHYYDPDQRSSIGITAALGRDVENVGSGLLVSPTFELTLAGTHRFAADALRWSIATDRQGTSYHRMQVDVGLRHTF